MNRRVYPKEMYDKEVMLRYYHCPFCLGCRIVCRIDVFLGYDYLCLDCDKPFHKNLAITKSSARNKKINKILDVY